MTEPRLLIVDDEPEFGEFVRSVAEQMGFTVRVAVTADDFFDAYESFDPTAIVLDIIMPTADGYELVRWLVEQQAQAALIFATGYDKAYAEQAFKLAEVRGLSSRAILLKPVELEDLKDALASIAGG